MISIRKVRMIGATILLGISALLSSCEDPQIYGSVGYSSYSGGYGGGMGTSISVGGRIR